MEGFVANLLAFLFICTTFSSFGSIVCVKYNTGSGIVEGKLNVHLVPHSHDDVGWLKTVDQYYVGSNNSIQDACVENTLDSVVESLLRDPNRKFSFAEMLYCLPAAENGEENYNVVTALFYARHAFFQRWWATQKAETQEEVRALVDAGRLEFINGGWVMHDEATTYYVDLIDQTTLGHRFIKETFNITPTAGWQIDTFGHSAVQAYLLGAELGFDSVHFARIDYQDKEKRCKGRSLEVIWRGSQTLGSSSQIFTNTFPVHYGPPTGFRFEVNADYEPVQDNHLLYDYNVDQRVKDFIDAALAQANVTRTEHIMWPMGGDFEYQYAETWFKQMDKLIHYVNKDGRVNVLYSTPSIYTDAKNTANETWPLKLHDYFPYADGENAYWTGFFTSRPAFKRYVRALSGYYLAARQLEFVNGRRSDLNTNSLGDSLAIAQHHDAITGTAKQHTTDDYTKRLAAGAFEAEAVVSNALSCLVDVKSGRQSKIPTTLQQCQLLNISYCPTTEDDIPEGNSLVVLAYNSLGWARTDVIHIPVNDANLAVEDSKGNTIEVQYVGMDNVTTKLRNFYSKAYVGISAKQMAKYWLFFRVSVPPMGWETYFISKASDALRGDRRNHIFSTESPLKHTVEIGPGNLKMYFSSSSGQLIRMFNSETGVDLPIKQSYLSYKSAASGAYIFEPYGAPSVVSRTVPIKVVRGPLVDEVHQQFASWIYQVTRLYKDKDHAEIEYTIGPIPTNDGLGKEVISQIKANMNTNKTFYTDSNGRDFLRRIRDHREDWNLSVNEPISGNYYPINLAAYITDDKHELSILVDRATGGSSIEDGEVELMLHRRTFMDDSRGVDEPLDETVCVDDKCEGLTIRGNYYMSINRLGEGAVWRRTLGQEIYSPLLLAFTHENKENWKSSHLSTGTNMDPNYSLPLNVALITLQELESGSVLLRLAHLYEAAEDPKYSTMAKVELEKMFAGRQIKEVKEMSLSANQERSQMRKLKWRVVGEHIQESAESVRGGPVDSSSLIVQLGPMEIRTFLLKF